MGKIMTPTNTARFRTPLVCATLVLLLAVPDARQTASGPTKELDAFVNRVMALGSVPGLAVAVARGSDIVYAKGFGFADVAGKRPVGAATQFYIASTTKSFTALAAQLLAAKGVIDLDMSIRRALPGAKFHPQVQADQITLRDLLTHSHGIAPGGPVDFRTAYTGEHTNALLLDLLRFHGPASTGKAFAYSNLGYNIFGLALDEKMKEGWKAVLQREVFTPLGMSGTTGRRSKANPDNLALPYELRASGPERVEYAKQDANMHAAGGHLSTANDLARYLVAHLNGGRIDGRQALPEAAVNATHRQQVEQNRDFGSFHRFGWGLGWDLATYDGDTVLQRFGGFAGFFSHLSFMPGKRVGVVVLSNGGGAGGGIADAVATHAYDLVLGKPGLAERDERRLAALTAQAARARESASRDSATRQARPQKTPLPLDAYAGTYENPELGRMVWTIENARLRVRMGIAQSGVEVYDGAQHQFRVELTGGGMVASFEVPAGARQPASVQFMSVTFVRRP
jgi:CubicO group peptidase (beta-lactamase class C family)